MIIALSISCKDKSESPMIDESGDILAVYRVNIYKDIKSYKESNCDSHCLAASFDGYEYHPLMPIINENVHLIYIELPKHVGLKDVKKLSHNVKAPYNAAQLDTPLNTVKCSKYRIKHPDYLKHKYCTITYKQLIDDLGIKF